MNKISAIVITKNEEELIKECLDSISFCDEIIVVDNDSTDKTSEIAKKEGAKIYSVISSSFSELRNIGLSKATGDWILYVDSDERVSKELVLAIKKTINSNEEFSAYKLKRKNYYLGKHEWPYIEKLERLFKKDALKGWNGGLHESPIVEGKIGEIEEFLEHYTHRDLAQMLKKTIEWSKIEADLRLQANHPKITWWRFPRVMITAFFDSYIKQGGWKVGIAGLVESIYQSFSMFVTYARLWEMQNNVNYQKSNIKND